MFVNRLTLQFISANGFPFLAGGMKPAHVMLVGIVHHTSREIGSVTRSGQHSQRQQNNIHSLPKKHKARVPEMAACGELAHDSNSPRDLFSIVEEGPTHAIQVVQSMRQDVRNKF
jgi:hypothetical protein